MKPAPRDPHDLLPLTPATFYILLALADGEQHGYRILQEINHLTRGTLRIGPTTLYRSIKQMLSDGLVVESAERPDPTLDDQRRRYYRLTAFGRQVALAEEERLAELLGVAQTKLPLPGLAAVHQMEGAS
jgi:DNA-binding PadR family transcriptional regulator